MDILMPQLGETVAEGKIVTWYKAAGDIVEPGDNLFEIETDKVTVEVPAIKGGVLAEIRIAAGQVAPVGAVVAVLSEGGEARVAPGPMPSKPPSPEAGSAEPTSALDPFHPIRTPLRDYGPARTESGHTATPLARRLAVEAGIDISRVTPSGAHGRITARDVTAVSASGNGAEPALVAGSRTVDSIAALYPAGSFEQLPLDTMRKTIAARLVEAKQTIPHFYLTTDVVLDRLMAVREEANAAMIPIEGVSPLRISVNDFVVRAFARALMQVPAANAVFAGDRILRFRTVDIGVAVALEGGLITPVVRDVGGKPIAHLAAALKDLVARARYRKLLPSEYQGGVATVSNLGMYGIREFAGVINPPQSSLLGVGAAERRPVEMRDGSVRFETRMTVTLSCDHRVVDGALGADLLAAFKTAIEHPVSLLV